MKISPGIDKVRIIKNEDIQYDPQAKGQPKPKVVENPDVQELDLEDFARTAFKPKRK